tara:strand:+ start:261 stop:434 length:174 start_codon:yes stop_codon:yes gene_type:complete
VIILFLTLQLLVHSQVVLLLLEAAEAEGLHLVLAQGLRVVLAVVALNTGQLRMVLLA